MKIKFAIFLILLFLIPVFYPPALTVGEWELSPGFRFWGFDIQADYTGFRPFAPLLTSINLMVGVGNETYGYFRYPDRTLYTPEAENNEAVFKKLNFDWGLGLRQGLVLDTARGSNLLEFYLYYRGMYDLHDKTAAQDALIFQSGEVGRDELLLNSIVTGLFFDTVVIDPVQLSRRGISLDTTLEYAPPLINTYTGNIDFLRLNVDLRGYLPLLRIEPSNNVNIFNLYICDRIIVDMLFGEDIPLYARQIITDRSLLPKDALGDQVRGIEAGRFDGYMKVINNFDIRMNFPGIRSGKDIYIVPGLSLYFDIGVFDNLSRSPTLYENGIYCSTGAGLFIQLFGFEIIIYENYFINEASFSTTFDFSLHF